MMVLSPQRSFETDQFVEIHHREFMKLGQRLFEVFGYDERSGQISTQIRNLQQIVCSALRFSDIENFIKNQMGKSGKTADDWRKLGKDFLDSLSVLRDFASQQAEDPGEQLAIRLKVARGWVRSIASEYLYQVALQQMERPS